MKRFAMAIIVAALTALGVVIPERYIDGFVTLFIPSAEASYGQSSSTPLLPSWHLSPYEFKCNWYCSCPPSPVKVRTTVEALRPSSGYFKPGLSESPLFRSLSNRNDDIMLS